MFPTIRRRQQLTIQLPLRATRTRARQDGRARERLTRTRYSRDLRVSTTTCREYRLPTRVTPSFTLSHYLYDMCIRFDTLLSNLSIRLSLTRLYDCLPSRSTCSPHPFCRSPFSSSTSIKSRLAAPSRDMLYRCFVGKVCMQSLSLFTSRWRASQRSPSAVSRCVRDPFWPQDPQPEYARGECIAQDTTRSSCSL